jgi:two-component system sensor histidine kinase PilS (NtrC family)
LTTPLAGLVEEEERLEGGARGVAALRLLLATLAIAVTAVLESARDVTELLRPRPEILGWHPVYSAAVAYCFLELIYLFLLRYARAARRLALLVASGLAADILLGSALVYFTGGYESAFLPLIFVWVIAAGTVLSGRMALGAASLAVVGLSAGSVLRYLHLFPYEAVRDVSTTAELWRGGGFHLAQSGALFAVAVLTGMLMRHVAAAQLVADHVLTVLQEGLVVLDRELKVRFANHEAGRLLGLDLPRGQPISEAGADARLSAVLRMLTARKAFGPAVVEVSPADYGPPLTLAISGAPVLSPRGAFRGLIAVISDRSAERRLEEVGRLAEQRRAVSELAMSIAHEIRNPLGAVRSAVQEIGREQQLSPDGRELVDVILSESDRLDRIVGDFLTFARPRPPVMARVDVRALATEAEELVSRSTPGGKKIEMVNEVPGGTEVSADTEQLRQALLNLGLNATTAIDGSGSIRVATRREALGEFLSRMSAARRARRVAAGLAEDPAGQAGLVIRVTDDGVGMDKETLRRAGEPFFTTRPGGTGLGLAIVERVASAHGGAVNIDSAPGEGSAVEIWLPAGEESESDG